MSQEYADGDSTPESRLSVDEVTQPASITALFSDAALYKRAIAGDAADREDCSEQQVGNPALRSVQDFAELVGNDLEQPEQDVVGRFAQLAVEDWSQEEGEHPDANLFSEEPDSLSEDEEASQTAVQPAKDPKLSPERVISLLIEEFGPLAPKGEERLLLDADGGVIQDVVILVRAKNVLKYS